MLKPIVLVVRGGDHWKTGGVMAFYEGSGLHEHGCVCAACAANSADTDSETASGAVYDEALSSYATPTSESGAGLISGRKWMETDLTYAYPAEAEAFDTNPEMAGTQYGSGEPVSGFQALSTGQVAAAEFAFAQYAAVSGLTFTRLADEDAAEASLRLAQSDAPSTAWGYYPSSYEEGGDAWFGTAYGYYDDPQRGDYAWHTMLHEIGHTLGLKHGHDQSGYGALGFEEDSMEFSVMTYRSYLGDPLNGGYSNEWGGYAQTLMQADIAAIQQLYGANYDHNAGDTRYFWDAETGEAFIDGVGQGAPADNRIFMTVWDGDGVDTFDFSDYRTGVSVDLAPGAGALTSDAQRAHLNAFEWGDGADVFASRNVYTARLFEGDERALIENAIGGAGHDEISGNEADNRLVGAKGADTLSGMDGDDRLLGKHGADNLLGGAGADVLKGGGWHDALSGDEGRDRLVGGGGRDVLDGGAGDDRLIGGRGADVFVFEAGDGDDRISDFQTGADRIDLTALNLSMGEVEVTDLANGALVTVANVSIRLIGVDADDLGAADFIF